MTIYILRLRMTPKVASPIPAAINTMVPIMIHISLLLPVITIVPIIFNPPFWEKAEKVSIFKLFSASSPSPFSTWATIALISFSAFIKSYF